MNRTEATEKLNEEILAINQEMEAELTPYRMKLQEINNEILRISKPYKEKITEKEEDFLDRFLIDRNGKTVRPGDIIINNETGDTYKVIKRFQQVLMRYLGNPRVVVLKLYKHGKIGKKEMSIFSAELKESYSIKEI